MRARIDESPDRLAAWKDRIDQPAAHTKVMSDRRGERPGRPRCGDEETDIIRPAEQGR